jgi:hypothetical protein
MVATVTLTNRSFKEIVNVWVLAGTKSLYAQDRGWLFEGATHIAPGETQNVEIHSSSNELGAFKAFPTSNSCELDLADFADGSSWEEPTPL